MSRAVVTFVLPALTLLLSLAGCSSAENEAAASPATTEQAVVPTVAGGADFANEVIRLVNAERVSRGLKPLAVNDKLNKAARFQAGYMAQHDCYQHECPGGPKLRERFDRFGLSYRTAAENIAAGYATPAEAATGWMNSPEHRKNILSPDFTDVGAGYEFLANDGGREKWGHYWTMNFAATVGAYDADRPLGAPDPVAIFLKTINEKRRAAGRAAFRIDERLNAAAQRRAAFIGANGCARKKCDNSPDLSDFMAQAGYSPAGASMQSIYGMMDPEEAARRICDNTTLINYSYKDAGAGFYYDPNDKPGAGFKLYWVIFAADPAGKVSAIFVASDGRS